MRFNLLLFKEKSKRIFASIGARAVVFRRNLEEEEKIRGKKRVWKRGIQAFLCYFGVKTAKYSTSKGCFLFRKEAERLKTRQNLRMKTRQNHENRTMIQKKATDGQKSLDCKETVISELRKRTKKDEKNRSKKLA